LANFEPFKLAEQPQISPTPEQGKIYWHDPFFEGLQLDLRQYSDVLEYHKEYELSKEALKIDVVIKNKSKTTIQHDIARLFREHNLIEYKSEKDYFSVWDYWKVLAYVGLYASANKVPLPQITMTIVLTKYPKSLIKHLKDENRVKIENQGNGIYYIKDERIKIQIVESKKLSKNDNLFLSFLRSNLTTNEAKEIGGIFETLKVDSKNIYFDRIVQANKSTFEEASNSSK